MPSPTDLTALADPDCGTPREHTTGAWRTTCAGVFRSARAVAAAMVTLATLLPGLIPALASAPAAAQQVEVDPALPDFEGDGGVSGQFTSIGSDTMLNMMNSWAELFQRFYPAARISVEGKGSSTAPPALISNQAQFGPMSRAMTPEEEDRFFEARGFDPTGLIVAIDTVAVFVHRDNPIGSISIEQIRDAFSVDGPDRVTWGDLGVDDPDYADRPVALYGRNSASGTYKYFKDTALSGVDYRPEVSDNPGSSGVVNAVSRDPYALGYSGIGYNVSGVKAVPVRARADAEAVEPTQRTAETGAYPFARPLWLYVAYDPRTDLDPIRERFIRMIYSRQGQEVVVRDGAFPVPAPLASQQLQRVGLAPGF